TSSGLSTEYTLTITDDDNPPIISFSPVSYTASESSGVVNITAVLSLESEKEISFDYGIIGGTAVANDDYTLNAGTLNILAGSTAKVFTCAIIDDSIDEDNETIIIGLSNYINVSETTGSGSTYTLNIQDDDNPPTVSWTSSTFNTNEGSGSLYISAQLSSESAKTVSFDFVVTDVSAVNGIDYTLASGTVTISAGFTGGTKEIVINDDAIFEPSESFIFQMVAYTNVSAGGITETTITITDNDTGPTISWLPDSASVSENSGSIQLTASLSMVSGLPASIDYTVSGTATNGMDYTLADGTLSIPAGSISGNITIFIGNDIIDENPETVIVRMVTYTHTSSGLSTEYTLTITDDDNPPIISFSPVSYTASESSGVVNITAVLSLESEKEISFDYGIIGGTAVANDDYTLNAGTLNILAGSTAKVFTCAIIDDSIDEDNETIIIGLSNYINVSETTGSGSTYTLNIQDDDNPPTVSWTSSTFNTNEGSGSLYISA
ncbi:MAG: hypothetical protein OMM_12998, partial [Candidatus Magnetoglobus multicellularis str. Araruama]